MTWWLLGECDEVITTEASSYGTTAAARTGITPIVCNHHKYCMRRLSPTPCQVQLKMHFLLCTVLTKQNILCLNFPLKTNSSSGYSLVERPANGLPQSNCQVSSSICFITRSFLWILQASHLQLQGISRRQVESVAVLEMTKTSKDSERDILYNLY